MLKICMYCMYMKKSINFKECNTCYISNTDTQEHTNWKPKKPKNCEKCTERVCNDCNGGEIGE